MKHLLTRKGWSGTAMILGKPLEVHWDGDALMLYGCSEELASAILGALSGIGMAAHGTGAPNVAGGAGCDTKPKPVAEEPTTIIPAAERAAVAPADRPKPGNAMHLPVTGGDSAPEQGGAKAETVKAEPAKTGRTRAAAATAEKPVEKVVEKAPEQPAAVAEPVETPVAPIGDIPDNIMQAARFKDVVVALQDSGTTTESGLVAAIESMKGRVPILSKVSDVKDRVQRTLQALGGIAANA